MDKYGTGTTFLEVLISIILLGFVVLTVASINLFVKFHLMSSDKRLQAQNHALLVMEHINKRAFNAIGNENALGANSVVDPTAIGGDSAIKIFVDRNMNGFRDAFDGWIAYRLFPTHALRFCPNYSPSTTNCTPAWASTEIVSNRIRTFQPNKASGILTQNSVDFTVTSCWDPGESGFPCGTDDNPQAQMTTRSIMPSVSVN